MIYNINSAIVISVVVESSRCSSKTLQKGSCLYAPLSGRGFTVCYNLYGEQRYSMFNSSNAMDISFQLFHAWNMMAIQSCGCPVVQIIPTPTNSNPSPPPSPSQQLLHTSIMIWCITASSILWMGKGYWVISCMKYVGYSDCGCPPHPNQPTYPTPLQTIAYEV